MRRSAHGPPIGSAVVAFPIPDRGSPERPTDFRTASCICALCIICGSTPTPYPSQIGSEVGCEGTSGAGGGDEIERPASLLEASDWFRPGKPRADGVEDAGIEPAGIGFIASAEGDASARAALGVVRQRTDLVCWRTCKVPARTSAGRPRTRVVHQRTSPIRMRTGATYRRTRKDRQRPWAARPRTSTVRPRTWATLAYSSISYLCDGVRCPGADSSDARFGEKPATHLPSLIPHPPSPISHFPSPNRLPLSLRSFASHDPADRGNCGRRGLNSESQDADPEGESVSGRCF